MTITAQLQRSWLVQRLNPPHRSDRFGGNPFAFGGGYKNGGLTDEAMAAVSSVCSFDYMGAAEFEFGALPKALHAMSKMKLIATSAEVSAGTVYLLCPAEWVEELTARIDGWASGDGDRLKEPTLLPGALAGDEWCRAVGWIELDNGFMFFTDPQMWRGAAGLFGVSIPQAKS